MKSYKKLLMSALVAAAVCSHTTQAVKTWIYGGVAGGGALGVITYITLGVKNSRANTKNVITIDDSFNKISGSTNLIISEKDASNKVEATRQKIMGYIGQKKYNVLNDKFPAKFNHFEGGKEYLGMDSWIVNKVTLLKCDDELGRPNSVSELSGDQLYSFLGNNLS